jgi:CheY-like chemotaxis protein
MSNEVALTRTILVVEDVRETRDGIEKLLRADGYQVALAGNEREAIASASLNDSDLILVSLAGLASEVALAALRIRARAEKRDHVPIVIFCIESLAEGEETDVGQGVYMTRPDNFNQLRSLLARLLTEQSKTVEVDAATTRK